MVKFVKTNILYIAFFQALVAVSSSLYLSEIKHFPPCVLCWYQRSLMYPLVIILAVGILRHDKGVYKYVLPITIIGMIVSFYHNLLYYQILPEAAVPCAQGVSCTTKFIELFGFATIPLLSLAGFAIITICMLVYRREVLK